MSVPTTLDEMRDILKPCIEEQFLETPPDDDIMPAFFTAAPSHLPPDEMDNADAPLAAMFIEGGMLNTPMGRAVMGDMMVRFAREMRATIAAFTCAAWTADYSEEERERIIEALKAEERIEDVVPPPADHPRRTEKQMVMMASVDEVMVLDATIFRNEGLPPALGVWNEVRMSRHGSGELTLIGPFIPNVAKAVDAAYAETQDWKGTA